MITFHSKCNQYCYAPITKNASMWGYSYFENILNFDRRQDWVFEQDKTYIVFLRDPYERWLSGITEYIWTLRRDAKLSRLVHPLYRLDELHFELIFDKIEFDNHSQNQIRFIREYLTKLETGNCYYFNLDDTNFNLKFYSFIFQKFKINNTLDKIHETDQIKFKKNIRTQIQKFLEANSKHKTRLLSYLKEDYEFIENANFYNITSDDYLNG